MISGIYRIVNAVNGKFYIGSSCDLERRKRQHELELIRGAHENKYLQRAFNLHGRDSFNFESILICANEHLLMYEQMIIDGLNATSRKIGYNLCPIAGSTLGRKLSEEAKQNMRDARKGMKLSEEHKKKINNAKEIIRKLGGYSFNWNALTGDRNGKFDYGLIAQEVKAIIPEAVYVDPDQGYYGIITEKLMPFIIEAMHEMQNEIDDLKEKLNGN
jgi:group I intron endonuclease